MNYSQSPANHFRQSPSSFASGNSTGMRRGMSYDGAAAGGQQQQQQQQISSSGNNHRHSLLPTSYNTSATPNQPISQGRPLSGIYGTPMTGIQHGGGGGGTSPRMHPPTSPSRYSAPLLPPSQSQSQSHSHPSTATASASNFYPQHIAQSYQPQPNPSTSTSNPSGSSSNLSVSPNPPPPQSVSPQQYYQSQTYLDSAMRQSSQPLRDPQSVQGGSSSNSPNVGPQLSPSHHHYQPQQQQGSGFYPGSTTGGGGGGGGGTDLRSLSLNSNERSPRLPNQGGGGSPSSPRPNNKKGLKKVVDPSLIVRRTNVQPRGRRASPSGGFISVRPPSTPSFPFLLPLKTNSLSLCRVWKQPLKALTTHLPQTYNLVNPQFHYETSLNPRRVLTKPSKPMMNDGFDNEDSDYILYVNDVLGPEEKSRLVFIFPFLEMEGWKNPVMGWREGEGNQRYRERGES